MTTWSIELYISAKVPLFRNTKTAPLVINQSKNELIKWLQENYREMSYDIRDGDPEE